VTWLASWCVKFVELVYESMMVRAGRGKVGEAKVLPGQVSYFSRTIVVCICKREQRSEKGASVVHPMLKGVQAAVVYIIQRLYTIPDRHCGTPCSFRWWRSFTVHSS
jgi:hypothetical protein